MRITEIFLTSILITAVIYDIRNYTVPNSLILLGYILACLLRFREGPAGAGSFFAGVLLPIVSLILLQRAGIIGGGDVKLLSVVGGFLGAERALYCILLSFFFGAALSLLSLIGRRNGRARIRFFLNYIQSVVHTGTFTPYYKPSRDGYEGTIHFSIAVMAAVMLLLWRKAQG